MSAVGMVRETIKGWAMPILRYQRHLSAAGMVLGFAIDNYSFGRIDRPRAHLIFGCYLVIAIVTIAAAHALQTRADRLEKRRLALARAAQPTVSTVYPSSPAAESGGPAVGELAPAPEKQLASEKERNARWRTWLPALTQFALGGLWSGFLVFYSRSASLAASWLFLATLAAFLVGNEMFRRYHARLVFASLLLFFALYSYAIFLLPLLTRNIGRLTFVLSGGLATLAFLVFLQLLARLGFERYRQSRWRLMGGAAAIVAAMNLFYFTGVLPPLPLSLLNVGIFHTVKRAENKYVAAAEVQPWYTQYGLEPATLHVVEGESISLYSAVFAPIRLTTRISHVWQRYDAGLRRWVTQSVVAFPISGGRDGGYRAYTVKKTPRPGDWRVDIKSEDGRLIGRLRFDVIDSPERVPLGTKVLP